MLRSGSILAGVVAAGTLTLLIALSVQGCDGPNTCRTVHEDCDDDNPCESNEDRLMLPGSDCLSCHRYGGPAADYVWTVAGTVFADELGKRPAEGAVVRITDADGTVIELIANEVGNFYTEDPVVFPYQAEVETEEGIVEMYEQPTEGSCNSCHKCEGPAGTKLAGE